MDFEQNEDQKDIPSEEKPHEDEALDNVRGGIFDGGSFEDATFVDLTIEDVEMIEGEAPPSKPAPQETIAPAQEKEPALPQAPEEDVDEEGEPLEMNISPDLTETPQSTSAHKEQKQHAAQSEEEQGQLPVQYGGKKFHQKELKTITGAQLDEAKNGYVPGDDENRGRIGDRLVSLGVISKDQLNVAIQEKKISGKLLGEVLVDLGFIDENTLTTFLAESSGFEVFDPKHTIFDGDVLALIDKNTAMKHQLLPVSMSEEEVLVAMADPYDVVALDTLRRFLPKGTHIKQLVSTPSILSDAIDAAYGYASSIQAILQELEEGKEQADLSTLNENEAYTHPIVRLVNALIFDAVKIGASDLHFEPEENFVRLRYRLDGVLFTAQTLHRQHWSGISQRIKIMSEMNIADKLGAQDGRFGLNINGREADFRVSSLPTVHGENIVIRVLDKTASIMPLSGLGFSDENLKKIRTAQSRPEGIIIVTGPTGSGKTTSLYSMLNEINDVEVNIQTLEDPVEYSLPMIRQTHVREGVLDFADGIRALLRQDPDIIFIGEIRDNTTADMALKAAMTGHQVYTTLHTNDSFGALPRLLDLGLKPGMISGAIIAVFAQRLARRLCPDCKESYTPVEEECRLLGVNSAKPPSIYRAKQGGCHSCVGQGYKGRVAVAEILSMDDELDDILADGGSKADLKTAAVKKGFKSMKEDGVEKVLQGLTSIEAIARVIDLNKL